MSTIGFVVRDDAGTLQRGSLEGSDGSNSVLVASGQDLSLNLQRGNFLSYVRQGQSLQVTLVDGQVLVIEGFFAADGSANADLFISADGELAKVDLVAGEGSLLYAQYVDSDNFGKWSPDDDLYFIRGSDVQIAGVVADDGAEVGMLAVPLLGAIGGLGVPAAAAAALGGGLLLAGSSGDDDDDDGGGGVGSSGGDGVIDDEDNLIVDTVAEVTIDTSSVETDGTINLVEEADGFVLTGTTQAGSTVVVSFGGVDYNATVTDGAWSLDVAAGVIEGGEYDLNITATATDSFGNTASTSGVVNVDTVISVTINTAAVGSDGTVNAEEHAGGVTVSGEAQAGATVFVTAISGSQSVSQTVTADANGAWTASYAPAQIDAGTYTLNFTAEATDTAGNAASATGTVAVDTELAVTVDTENITSDNVVNAVERNDGLTLDGTTEAGATVEVEFNGVTVITTANSSGEWSADWSASDIPTGELSKSVSVKSTDAAGNVATTSGVVEIDTFVNNLEFDGSEVEGENVVNNAEAADGVTLGGSVESGSTVSVTYSDGSGGTVTKDATVSLSGTWTVAFYGDEIPAGEYEATVAVTATDAAGNTSQISDTFDVDTVAPDAPQIINVTDQIGAGVVSFAMADSEGSMTVHEVELDGVAGASKSFAKLDITAGEDHIAFDSSAGVQDGSHLIVTDEDGVGNTNSTLFVLDDQATNNFAVEDVNTAGFNVGEIELTLAEDTNLTLSTQDIIDMSDNDSQLVIHGSSDDSVVLDGTATAAGTETIDGKVYNLHTLDNDDTTLIIAADIPFSTV